MQVNISYILWITAFNTSFLVAYIIALDLGLFAPSQSSTSKKNKNNANPRVDRDRDTLHAHPGSAAGLVAAGTEGNPPRLLEVVNKHSLAVFLLVRSLLRHAINSDWVAGQCHDGRGELRDEDNVRPRCTCDGGPQRLFAYSVLAAVGVGGEEEKKRARLGFVQGKMGMCVPHRVQSARRLCIVYSGLLMEELTEIIGTYQGGEA